MIVLLLLYPVVFLFGIFVQTPLADGGPGAAVPVALFVGNIVSVILLNWLVPWTSTRFDWWLSPARARLTFLGAALLLALYGVMVFAFTHLP